MQKTISLTKFLVKDSSLSVQIKSVVLTFLLKICEKLKIALIITSQVLNFRAKDLK